MSGRTAKAARADGERKERLTEAGKKAEVLGIVAKADGEKAAARADQETDRLQAQLREAAEQRRPQVLAEIRKIVLGQS